MLTRLIYFFMFYFFFAQDNDEYTALMLAIKFYNKERDPKKKEDYEKIARSLVKHRTIDMNKKKNGKTVYEMFKSKKILDILQ